MSRITRFVVLVAGLMSLLGVMSSTAGAVTWVNDGDTHFTAMGGAGTLSSTGVFLGLGSQDLTGTTTTSVSGVNARIMHFTGQCTGCTLGGQSFGLECGMTWTAATQTTVAPRVTSGTLDMTCGIYLAGIKTCHITGTLSGSYTNPTPPSTFGKLTTTTGGALRITNGQTNCQLGANDPVHLSPLTFTVSSGAGGPTPHLGPSITAV